MRVAPEMDSCGLRMSRLPPPHPPTSKTPPKWGQAGQKQGGADSQNLWGVMESVRKIRGLALKNRCNPHGSKEKCLTDFSKNPRKHCFCPRICQNIHGFVFVVFWSTLSLSFSFTNEKEREREAKTSKIGKKPNPRIFELLKFSSPEKTEAKGHFRGFGGFLKAALLYKSMAYAANGTNPRFFTKNALPLADSSLQLLGFTLVFGGLVDCAFGVYNRLVTSKTGVIGFDSPAHQAAQSRNLRRSCGFFVRAPSFGGSNGEPQGSPVKGLRLVPGLSTRSSRRLCLTASASVLANCTTWRPNMATSAFSPDFVDLVTGIQNDARQTSLALTSIMQLLRGCDAEHQLSAGALQSLLEPIWGSLDTLCGDLKAMHVGEVAL